MVEAVCGSGEPPATSKHTVLDGVFLRLLPNAREPQWKFEESLSTLWSMVFGASWLLELSLENGWEVGYWCLTWTACALRAAVGYYAGSSLFYILYFCMPFAKWWCFSTWKKMPWAILLQESDLFWMASLPEIFLFGCDYQSSDFKMLPSGTSSNKRFLKQVRVGAAYASWVCLNQG